MGGEGICEGMGRRVKLFRLLLEWASLATALSFLVSALAYCLIFGIWGLDFTAVATVEDVVMGGIRLLSFAIPVALIVAFYCLAGCVIAVRHSQIRETKIFRWVLVASGMVSLLLTIVLYATGDWAELPLRQRSWFVAILVHLLSAGGLVILTSVPRIRLIRPAATLLVSESRWLTLAFTALASIFVMVGVSLAQYEGMSIISGATLPSKCSSLPAAIRWIGSRSIVVSCGEETFVVGNSDSVVLAVRPFPRPDRGNRTEQLRERQQFLQNTLNSF